MGSFFIAHAGIRLAKNGISGFHNVVLGFSELFLTLWNRTNAQGGCVELLPFLRYAKTTSTATLNQ
jgi:hypothetical protein